MFVQYKRNNKYHREALRLIDLGLFLRSRPKLTRLNIEK